MKTSAALLAASTCACSLLASSAYAQQAALETAPAAAPLLVRAKAKPDKEWKQYPTRTLESLPGFVPQQAELDLYGGWKNAALQQKPSGFFAVKKLGARWWLLDPEGNAFLHAAVVSVTSGGTPAAKASFAAKFQSDKLKWAAASGALLRENGFNGTGAWSDVEAVRSMSPRLAYTCIWNFMSSYGKARGGTFQAPGHTGYPDDLIFIFDPEFEAFCDQFAQQVAETKDDPWLVGHFSDNELPFNLSSLDKALARPATDNAGRAARAYLKQQRHSEDVAQLSDEERAGFLNLMADKYFALTTAAIRKYDPNHLCLGPRLHGGDAKRPSVWRAAGKYLDAIAINYYGQWTPQQEQMNLWAQWSGRPFLVTEWYVKGADVAGLENKGGAGWIVPTQEDRGLFYQNFALGLLENPNCVGFHWFKYMDNDPQDLKADPSNRDSNKGIVSTGYEPYAPLLARMKSLNAQLYPLAAYFDARR